MAGADKLKIKKLQDCKICKICKFHCRAIEARFVSFIMGTRGALPESELEKVWQHCVAEEEEKGKTRPSTLVKTGSIGIGEYNYVGVTP